jgi:hypothetical protein
VTAAIDQYLIRRGDLTRPMIGVAPDEIDLVVVVPVLGESRTLPATLYSLAASPADERLHSLVLCVVNNRTKSHARSEDIEENNKTLAWLKGIVTDGSRGLGIAVIDASTEGHELSQDQGVGTARKLGMDRALVLLNRPDGIIVSLDADTSVETNYFAAVRRHFRDEARSAAVIAYAHDLPEAENLREAIVSYELYLRYHELGLCFAGSPYAFHTIGSATACSAEAYAAAGGMNQREAGEDFYFLQELAKRGPVTRITDTTVHPSARASHRVPFGTGAYISKHVTGPGHTTRLYNPNAYRTLRLWLRCIDGHCELPAEELIALFCGAVENCSTLHGGEGAVVASAAREFVRAAGFAKTWPKLQAGAGNRTQLLAQFHRWFDALKTLRLVHALRDNCLPNLTRTAAFRSLLSEFTSESLAEAQLDGQPAIRESFLIHLREQHENVRRRMEKINASNTSAV